jgi:electron transport complex protein RnfB
MADPLTLLAVLGGLGAAAGLALSWADRRFKPDPDTLIDAIDTLLPQTQCAQCGYPGCRPYAAAIAQGEAIDLCPPGGPETAQALARLLGRAVTTPPPSLQAPVAVIDEARCIGCYLCIPACPVDAIIGAPQFMHTVIRDRCTGCGLCVAPCPVDCIDLVDLPMTEDARPIRIMARPRNRAPAEPELPCIRCGLCEASCPELLQPQELLWYTRTGAWDEAADRGLDRCIECGLCNQVCPSNIDLLVQFTRGRQALAGAAEQARQALEARARFERHEARTTAGDAAREARRRERLQRAKDRAAERPWQR